MVHLSWQGREHQVETALTHIKDIHKNQKTVERSDYLLVHGGPGSGKTRFLIKVASRLPPTVLRLACTFNCKSQICRAELERWCKDACPTLPVTARLLYHYARGVKDRRAWENWLEDFQKIPSIGQLSLRYVIKRLIKRFKKQQAVLLIDETCLLVTLGKWSEATTESFMGTIMSEIQDKGVPVIFSLFATNLVRKDLSNSLRNIKSVALKELPSDCVKNIFLNFNCEEELRSLSSSLGIDSDTTFNLLISCLGGTPRVIEVACKKLRCSASLIDLLSHIGHAIAERYSPPLPFDLLMDALGNALVDDKKYLMGSHLYPLSYLINAGFCQDDSDHRGRVLIAYPWLLASAYTHSVPSDYPAGFCAALREFLTIPLSRPQNIWEEFFQRLLILRSFRYSIEDNGNQVSLALKDIFSPLLQLNKCLEVRIVMKRLSTSVVGFQIPPRPAQVKQFPNSIWCPMNEFESGIDSLMFFAPESGGSDDLICLGIQNKWSIDDGSTIALPELNTATIHFYSKMLARGWNREALRMLFILKKKIPQKVILPKGPNQCQSKPRSLDPGQLFGEVAIISTNDGSLSSWLSPPLVGMVERFQYLSVRLSESQSFKCTKAEYTQLKKETKEQRLALRAEWDHRKSKS
jgi:hypothetical protein